MATNFEAGTELLRAVQVHEGPRFHISNENEQMYVASVLIVHQRKGETAELERLLRLLVDKVPEVAEIIAITAATKLGKPIADAYARVQAARAS